MRTHVFLLELAEADAGKAIRDLTPGDSFAVLFDRFRDLVIAHNSEKGAE